MELCPNCENQIEQEQIVCSVCGMILKDIRRYPNLVKPFFYICLAIIIIAIVVNLVGHLLIFFN
ncbi:MAG: DUF2116 family Zn-ribbon domain-containing protein [Candidatus Hodarchaeota archaeon]